MLYIKLFIEREKNIGQSAPECPFNVPQTHYRSYRDDFYGSDDSTNSVKALKDNIWLLHQVKDHSHQAGTLQGKWSKYIF